MLFKNYLFFAFLLIGLLITNAANAYSISGYLDPNGDEDCYGSWSLVVGDYVNVNISWMPSVNIEVGLKNNGGTFYGVGCSGGACSVRRMIVIPGTYAFCVRNISQSYISYTGFYWFD